MLLSHNFHSEEFDSPDAPGSGVAMSPFLIEKLQTMRDLINGPIVINSGFRTKSHNKKVGGVSNSSHLNGTAVDIECNTDAKRMLLLNAAILVGFRRIGIGKTFIHLDVDTGKNENRVWLY